jgi:hypothetical protein
MLVNHQSEMVDIDHCESIYTHPSLAEDRHRLSPQGPNEDSAVETIDETRHQDEVSLVFDQLWPKLVQHLKPFIASYVNHKMTSLE